jgi:hypothetical protein
MKRFTVPAAVAVILAAGSAQAGAASPDQMRRQTADIASRYIAVWSSDAESSVAGVPYIYGPRTRFYGRDMTQAQLMAEKQRAIRQWPARRYSHRAGTMKVLCNEQAARCVASSIIDYEASNPSRGTSKRGSARFDLGVDFTDPSGKPKILFEGGSIGRRRV